MDIKFSTEGIDDLQELLAAARLRPHAERAKAMGAVVPKVEAEARANASSYTKDSTGELAASIEVKSTPVFATISADPRQGWFLEYGSPNTGGPDPWLSGPAQKGADELFELISKAGHIF